jgi:hypothetical protein
VPGLVRVLVPASQAAICISGGQTLVIGKAFARGGRYGPHAAVREQVLRNANQAETGSQISKYLRLERRGAGYVASVNDHRGRPITGYCAT